jgi:hypothetical protein
MLRKTTVIFFALMAMALSSPHANHNAPPSAKSGNQKQAGLKVKAAPKGKKGKSAGQKKKGSKSKSKKATGGAKKEGVNGAAAGAKAPAAAGAGRAPVAAPARAPAVAGAAAVGAAAGAAGAAGAGSLVRNICPGSGLTRAAGQQSRNGLCSETTQGDIPAFDKMVSTMIMTPANGATLQEKAPITVTVRTVNMELGTFLDPDTLYYSKYFYTNSFAFILTKELD